ncbi:hypothetical protein TWF481_012190 [Arthrobotrys musiformis]|uniref:Eisosome protein 1 n=1 Tax=Arthrobotrys musiformis TaxID=47236 RepID=A0AAV9VWA6_9PEZI
MFGTKPLGLPETSSDLSLKPTTAAPPAAAASGAATAPGGDQPITEEELIFSTPRSELNNPMSPVDQVLLDSTNKANKDAKDGDATTSVPVVPAETGAKSTTPATTSLLLKRANPKDLPSYPSRGVQNLEASAGKAASLAASYSKSPEVWKPDRLPAAGAAASLANNIKSPEPWKSGPLPTAAAAALLAGDSKPPEAWRPSTPSKSASQAATSVRQRAHTMPESKRPPLQSPQLQPQQSTASALAAAGIANSPKKLSKPAPKSPPTPAYDISKINALAAQNAQTRLSAVSQPRSALPQSQTDKNMSDILRAASISMAKNMNKSPPPASKATTSMPPGSYYSHIPTSPKKIPAQEPKLNRKSSTQAASIAASSDLHSVISADSDDRQVKYYPHLEEAARKAASERLARLQAEHDRARKASGLPPSWQAGGVPTTTRARSSTAPSSTPKAAQSSKAATTTGATARRQPDATDYARSLKIKSDTAKLTKQIDSVDKDRQARDYLAILAVAEKNVKARMQDLETKVAEDQGRVPKHLQAEWDAKAKMLSAEYERKRAEESEKKKGKINMGGGLWYDQEDLERIARGNVQPILDEINVKAEKERARVEALRVEKEATDRERKAEQERVAGVKAETKKARVLEKAAAKSRRDAEKAEERERKAELKKAQREEKERLRTEKQTQKAAAVPLPASTSNVEENAGVGADNNSDMEELEPRPMSQAGHDRVDREREMHEAAKKEKGWFGSLQKRLAKRVPGTKKKEKNVVGGEVAMPQVAEVDEFNADNQSISSISSPERPNSARDVALAGTVSVVSSDDEVEPAGTVFVGGAGLEAVDATTSVAARPRYVDSDSSSSSSGDLYTAEPRYKGLTSATYNPGTEDEGLGMPAFVPETSRRYSTSSDSSLESISGGVAEKTFGEEAGPSVAAEGTEGEGRETFGNTLSGKVKKSLEEFAKAGGTTSGIAVQTSIQETPITQVEPPTPIEELKGPIMPAAAAEGSSRGSMDSTREKRSSRFSEIL